MERKRHRRVALLCLFMFLALIFGTGAYCRIQVLVIGDRGPVIPARKGDIFELCYTQSMYGVPVTERYRIGEGFFVLFHVLSNRAALEYLGIESRHENNVVREGKGFTVPAASVGNHFLHVGRRSIPLSACADSGGRVFVGITTMPVIVYIINALWR
jgi:hypothetical protein